MPCLGVSAAWAMMIQMSPLFWRDERTVLKTSERLNKTNRESWDKLPAEHARRFKDVASAFSGATEVTHKVDDLVLNFCAAQCAYKLCNCK